MVYYIFTSLSFLYLCCGLKESNVNTSLTKLKWLQTIFYVASALAHTLELFNHNYWRKYTHFFQFQIENTATCCSMITLCFVTLISKKNICFQFDLLLKLFEDDEKAPSSTNKRTSVTGRAGQTQRETKKTVGLQVRRTWCLVLVKLSYIPQLQFLLSWKPWKNSLFKNNYVEKLRFV